MNQTFEIPSDFIDKFLVQEPSNDYTWSSFWLFSRGIVTKRWFANAVLMSSSVRSINPTFHKLAARLSRQLQRFLRIRSDVRASMFCCAKNILGRNSEWQHDCFGKDEFVSRWQFTFQLRTFTVPKQQNAATLLFTLCLAKSPPKRQNQLYSFEFKSEILCIWKREKCYKSDLINLHAEMFYMQLIIFY